MRCRGFTETLRLIACQLAVSGDPRGLRDLRDLRVVKLGLVRVCPCSVAEAGVHGGDRDWSNPSEQGARAEADAHSIACFCKLLVR